MLVVLVWSNQKKSEHLPRSFDRTLISLHLPSFLQGKESRWSVTNKLVNKEDKITLTFAVKQQNVDLLDKKLMEVSSPSSPKYGKHLTLHEVNQLTQPSNESIQAVVAFMKSFGINTYKYSSGFLKATVSIDVAEKMLATNYQKYSHAKSGVEALRCASYSLPEEVAKVENFGTFLPPTL